MDALREENEALRIEIEQLRRSSTLSLDEYRRYGRQMVLPGFGLPGQLRLRQSKVLVIGAGGLGCPALLYLAGAGVGHITIVDHDTVELSNLHRQVLHSEARLGQPKALSAREALLERNSDIQVEAIVAAFTRDVLTTLDLPSFDLVLDCTDNAPTRYLINDACVRSGIPLVSGAAIRVEGQMAIWNMPLSVEDTSQRGPCYRCIFPPPSGGPISERCDEQGVLGVVTGVIGTLMATEAIKLLTGLHDRKPSLMLYSPLGSPAFRTLKIRARKPDCAGCGTGRPAAIEDVFEPACAVNSLSDDVRVMPKDALLDTSAAERPMLLDVRPAVEYGICSLPHSTNIPLDDLLRDTLAAMPSPPPDRVTVVCRKGNDSLVAARALRQAGIDATDITGGLQRYAADVDPNFPIYVRTAVFLVCEHL